MRDGIATLSGGAIVGSHTEGSVTEKMVTNLNLNFKFLFNVKFGSWAFRNCAYFVMEPSGCDTIRLGV